MLLLSEEAPVQTLEQPSTWEKLGPCFSGLSKQRCLLTP